jgi:Flp pilus assembly protein CpaB
MVWSGSQVAKGLFTDATKVIGQTVMQAMAEGEPVLESRLASASNSGAGIPSGMRAVSVHVSDSSGILTLLKAGNKVDVQVFASKPGEKGQEVEARTAFQNIRVLAVGTQAEPSSLGGFNAPVITLLTTAKEADALGVADSFGRIRLALRNPIDDATETKAAMPLAAVLRGSAGSLVASNQKVAPASSLVSTSQTKVIAPSSAVQRGVGAEVGLTVELLSVSPEGMNELRGLGLTGKQNILDASMVSKSADIEKVLAGLRERKSVDVLASSRVNAGMSRTASVELRAHGDSQLASASEAGGGLRVQFVPFLANGQIHLKVQPEVTVPGVATVGTRRSETEVDLSGWRSFFISGLTDLRERDWLLERWLGPSRTVEHDARELLVVVTPRLL